MGYLHWAFDIATAIMSLSSFVVALVSDISNAASVSMHISARCDMPQYVSEPKSPSSLHFQTSLMIGCSQSMAMSRKLSQKTVRSRLESMLHFRTTSTQFCIMTCFQDIWLPGFSTSSTSVPLIGTPRNRVQLRQCHLGLSRMPQGLLQSRSLVWHSPLHGSSIEGLQLHKRHSMLSYHCVREACASGMVKFFHIPGEINPADILSKHWGHQQIWKQLQPLLFWKGDTWKLLEKEHCKEVYNGIY